VCVWRHLQQQAVDFLVTLLHVCVRVCQLELEFRGVLEQRDREVESQCEAVEASMARMRAKMQECHDRRLVFYPV
jgi:hypothetical protein